MPKHKCEAANFLNCSNYIYFDKSDGNLSATLDKSKNRKTGSFWQEIRDVIVCDVTHKLNS